MISTKSPEELEFMHRANSIVLRVLEELRERAKPGVSTGDLDDHAHERIRQEGVRSAFLGYRGFPKVLCASVNEEIVHGIPSSRKILNEGDIVGLDFGVVVEGFFGEGKNLSSKAGLIDLLYVLQGPGTQVLLMRTHEGLW